MANIDILCSDCGKQLDAEWKYVGTYSDPILRVDVCENCLEKAIEKSKEK